MKFRGTTALALAIAMLLSLLPAALAGASDPCRGTGGDHEWSDWEVTEEPTCTSKGTEIRYCEACGVRDTRETAKAKHNWGKWKVTKEATCTEQGKRTHTCLDCGETESEALDKIPHDWSQWEIIEDATDDTSGTRRHTCAVCGAEETEAYDLEGTLRRGDDGAAVKQLQEGLICYGALDGRADGIFGRATQAAVAAVQAAQGMPADGVARPRLLQALGHRFGDWETVSEMTDFSKGVYQRTCERCGYTQTEEEWPTPTYQRGDAGEGVKDLQEKLNAAGYDCGKADGKFGGKTAGAVSAIESAHGVEADGIAWPGVQKWLTAGGPSDAPEAAEGTLVLTVAKTSPAKDEYAIGDEVSFDWTLVNYGNEDLTLDHVFMDWGGEGPESVSDKPVTLSANGASTLSDTWTKAIDGEWIVDGRIVMTFYGRGYTAAGAGNAQYIVSNKVDFRLSPAPIEFGDLPETGMSGIHLKSGPVSGVPEEAVSFRRLEIVKQTKNEADYYDGAKIPVRMRLTIDTLDEYDLLGISVAPGDSISDTGWADGVLEAGQSYEFTYTMVLDPEQTGWKKRDVTVSLRSRTYNDVEEESCEVRPPFTNPTVTIVDPNSHVIDYPAFLYLTIDEKIQKEGLSGYPLETMSLPITVTTNAADKFSDVRLIALTDWDGKSFYMDTWSLSKKMAAHETRDFLCHITTRALEEKWTKYTLTLYVTGKVMNVKGNVETISSLPITVPLRVEKPTSGKEALELTYTITPSRSTYWANDKVSIRMMVKNAGKTPIKDVRIGYADGYDHLYSIFPGIDPVPNGNLLEPGQLEVVYFDFDMPKAFVDSGKMDLGFVATGAFMGTNNPARSKRIWIYRTVDKAIPETAIGLSAKMVTPQESYAKGVMNYTRLTLTNDTDRIITSVRFYAVGDNRNQSHNESAQWFDLGHGMKGWQCYSSKSTNLKPGESMTVDVPTTIPEAFPGDVFTPCWVADAELWGGVPARSNAAAISLPVADGAPEEEAGSSITLDVEQLTPTPASGVWHDGDEVKFKVQAVYTGPEVPNQIVINAQEKYTDMPQAWTDIWESWACSDELTLTLDASFAQDGVYACKFTSAAFAKDQSGSLAFTQPKVFSFPMDMDDPDVKDLVENGAVTFIVNELTECPDPNGWWHDGDTVSVEIKAVYKRKDTPLGISVDATDGLGEYRQEYSESVYDEKTLSYSFDIDLEADTAVGGQCTYDFVARVFTKSFNYDTYTAGPVQLVYDMAPGGKGADTASEGGGTGAPDTQINWDAVKKAEEAIESEGGEAEGAGDPAKAEDDKADASDGSGKAEDKADASDDSGKAEDKADTSDDSGKAEDKAEASDDSGKAEDKADASDDSGKAEDKAEVSDDTGKAEDKADASDGSGKAEDKADVSDDSGKAEDDKSEVSDGSGKAEDDKSEVSDGSGKAEDKAEVSDDSGKAEDKTAETTDGSGEDGITEGSGTAEDKADATGKASDGEASTEDGGVTGGVATGCTETFVAIPGGAYDIPATVCIPDGEGPFPAVVMLHGTGSSRDEAGDGYKHAAPVLAEKYGIATIRVDFPGCGESTADATLYDFRSAVSDAKAAADYMAGLECIDANAIGVMGWSQGGTDALLACAWEPETFRSIVTWAGAPDLMLTGSWTSEDYAEAVENGFFAMEFDWREPLNVSLQWCDDVLRTDVLKEFSEGYDGPVLAVAGTDTENDDYYWSGKIVEASGNEKSKTYFIKGMDHTFNVFTEEDLHSLYEAVDATGAFFRDTLG